MRTPTVSAENQRYLRHTRVVPGNADVSLLYQKISMSSSDLSNAVLGMLILLGPSFDPSEIEGFDTWINQDAMMPEKCD